MGARGLKVSISGQQRLREISAIPSEPGAKELIESGLRVPLDPKRLRDGSLLILGETREEFEPWEEAELISALSAIPAGFMVHFLIRGNQREQRRIWPESAEQWARSSQEAVAFWRGGADLARGLWGSEDWNALIEGVFVAIFKPGAVIAWVELGNTPQAMATAEREAWESLAARWEALQIERVCAQGGGSMRGRL